MPDSRGYRLCALRQQRQQKRTKDKEKIRKKQKLQEQPQEPSEYELNSNALAFVNLLVNYHKLSRKVYFVSNFVKFVISPPPPGVQGKPPKLAKIVKFRDFWAMGPHFLLNFTILANFDHFPYPPWGGGLGC